VSSTASSSVPSGETHSVRAFDRNSKGIVDDDDLTRSTYNVTNTLRINIEHLIQGYQADSRENCPFAWPCRMRPIASVVPYLRHPVPYRSKKRVTKYGD
jgi:hypothetical protein